MAHHMTVSGTLSPDATGEYEYTGVYNGEPYFQRLSSPFYLLFWSTSQSSWFIAQALHANPPNSWQRNDPNIEGNYTAVGTYTGTATVAHDPEVTRPSTENQLILTDEAALDFEPAQMHFDWVRWCYASINKHFEDRKSTYELYIEGDDRTQQDEAEFAELRIDGPFISVPQKDLYYLLVEINVLCQTHMDPRRHYKAQQMVGVFLKAFENLINVYKHGDGPLDDGSLLGCFHLSRELGATIDVSYFGIIRPDTKIMQTTIEGHYRLELWTKGD